MPEKSINPILEMKGIRKSFPGVKALSGVDFRLFRGEVHALMGQNGAGKSTLIKVITGVNKQEAGEIRLGGKLIRPDSPLEAQKLGISTVYQEINLCPNLTVAENIFIGREPMRLGMIDWKKMNEKSEKMLSDLSVSIDVTQLLSSYSVAIQQMVAIARVLDITAKILILDEPTSSLDEKETNLLFSVIRQLRDKGMAILFVTHFLEQTYQISDRITVLKNGERVGEFMTKELPKVELISKMLGKELSEFSYSQRDTVKKAGVKETAKEKKVVLKAEKLSREGAIAPLDLEISKGEILGFAGLLGSGRSETARLLFGIDKADQGDIYIKGKKATLNNPINAINAGLGFCPEDRKLEGVIGDLSVRENIILAIQSKKGILGNIPLKKQQEIADGLIKMIDIKTTGTEQEAGKLSGGNQQKLMLARWLATNPELLILDEPTRGIDVGAKLEIMELILKLAKQGMALLFISTEIDEVVRCSDEVAVFKDRKKVNDLKGEEVDENRIMHIIAGGKDL